MVLQFAGRHCVVVGATGVIGSSIARAFAQHGAVVSLLGRSAVQVRHTLESQLRPYSLPETGNGTANAAAADGIPSAHRFIRLDVSNREEIKALFSSRTLPSKPQDDVTIGPIDILVNCAGISQTTFLKRTPDEELSSIVDTNLLATMLVCKHAKMRSNGCIINVSSLMATKGGLGATAYAASKAGVVGKSGSYCCHVSNFFLIYIKHTLFLYISSCGRKLIFSLGFTRALCREMASRSIRVNALLPGWVNSSMWTDLKPELQQAYLKDTPLNRVADPAEVANAALFLASNGFANNCILNLDGGLSAA
ncbi:3-ketoacyl-reductase [Trichoderma sp. SZMC 28014]